MWTYKKGELKGKLKEIAARLNEESNKVLTLIKHKIKNNSPIFIEAALL